MEDKESDYDLLWILTDEACEGRRERGEPLQIQTSDEGMKVLDGDYTCPSWLSGMPEWAKPGFATSRILLDKTGQVGGAVQGLVTLPDERARDEAAAQLDGYLNGFYRSLKAARRGNELGARLEAAESLMYLVRTLFALERRLPPYHDRLITQLDSLGSQGWAAGELEGLLLAIARTGSPTRQQELERRVEVLGRARGFGQVVDAWGSELDRVKAFEFD